MRRGDDRRTRAALFLTAALAVSGCGGWQEGLSFGSDGDGNVVSRFLQRDFLPRPVAITTQEAAMAQGAHSAIVSTLQERRSILDPVSPYGRVSAAVMASSARASEADLRAARLRAQAAAKNWLPSIGPNLSLSSMGDFVASLLVEQVLFDNGRRKAERAYAAHDVEYSAVTLAEDTNARIHEALTLYLAAEEGRETARTADRSLEDMGQFEWVMAQRVEGGVSDRSDLNVIRQKLAQIRARRAAAAGDARAALAELQAMAGRPLDKITGVPAMHVDAGGAEPLSVLKAAAERDRQIAQARIARAGHLPGLKASGSVTGGGDTSYGLTVAADQLLGLGTGASLSAIEAAKDAAARKVTQAGEDARRRMAALRQKETALALQLVEANNLTRQAKRNLDLFQAQYKGGARRVMDVVGVYETWAQQSQTAIDLKYDLARVQIELARDYGVLADGSEI